MALEHGDELDYHCAAAATVPLESLQCATASSGIMCHRFLDLTGPLYVGGLPVQTQQDARLSSRFFDGCIRDLKLEDHLLDMNNYIEEQATESGEGKVKDILDIIGDILSRYSHASFRTGCPAKDDHCLDGGLCLNGGT